MKFDNKIPFQEAVDLAKKVASGDLSLQTVKEGCWILGCTIEALDGDAPTPPPVSISSGSELAELKLLAEQVSEFQVGFGDAAGITPAQIALIIQLVRMVIDLFGKK